MQQDSTNIFTIENTLKQSVENNTIIQQDSIHNVFEALSYFIFEKTPIEQIKEMGYDKYYLVYILSACIFGAICLVLDTLLVKIGITKKSFLGLDDVKGVPFTILFILWIIGAGVVSWLGYIVDLLQPTIQSSLICAVSWVYILKNLVTQYSRSYNEIKTNTNE